MSAKTAGPGCVVQIRFTGKLKDGSVFDGSGAGNPFELRIGDNSVIPGLEKAVLGMRPGERKSVRIEPEDAYGMVDERLTAEVPRSRFPDDIQPVIGQYLQVRKPNGEIVNVTVVEVHEKAVVLDANHPLAGKTLYFDLELIEVTCPDSE